MVCPSVESEPCLAWDPVKNLWDNTPEDKQAKELSDAIKNTLAGPFANFLDCAGAMAYPFIPVVKPEDMEDAMGLSVEGGEAAADSAAWTAMASAEQIRNSGRIGPSRLGRIASLEGKAARYEKAGKIFKGFGYLLGAKDAFENLDHCGSQSQ